MASSDAGVLSSIREKFNQLILNPEHTKDVLLVGSRARQDHNEESDFDMAGVNFSDEEMRTLGKEMGDLASSAGVKIELKYVVREIGGTVAVLEMNPWNGKVTEVSGRPIFCLFECRSIFDEPRNKTWILPYFRRCIATVLSPSPDSLSSQLMQHRDGHDRVHCFLWRFRALTLQALSKVKDEGKEESTIVHLHQHPTNMERLCFVLGVSGIVGPDWLRGRVASLRVDIENLIEYVSSEECLGDLLQLCKFLDDLC